MRLSQVTRPAFEKHTHWAEGPPTKILFVRHGETDWNVNGVIQGWRGSGLNALGLRQARLAAKRVQGMDLGIDAVLCSDLKRARQTADAIAGALGLKARSRRDLRERCFGDWEGCSIAQILERYQVGPKSRKDPFLAFDPEGGESMTVFARRMDGFLKSVLREYPGRVVVAVSHGGPVRVSSCLAVGIAAKRYFLLGRPGNVSFTLLAHQGGSWWMECYNDMAHLEGRGPAALGTKARR